MSAPTPTPLETVIKESCRDWTRNVTAPADLADRVLERRAQPGRRVAHVAVPLAAVAIVLVVGLVLALVTRVGHATPPPASRASASPSPHDTSLHTDPDHYQPTRLVAAGQQAIGAFSTLATPNSSTYTWHVYDPEKGRYVVVPYADVQVAPGLRQAAVLERSRAHRVGLLDLLTMKVTRWLPATYAVSATNWSPDGSELVLTDVGPTVVNGRHVTARIGFSIVDVATGKSRFQRLGVSPSTANRVPDTSFLDSDTTQSLFWDTTGTLLWEFALDMSSRRDFFDLKGHPVTPPGHEAEQTVDTPITPDGRLIAKPGADAYPGGPAVSVVDLASGKLQKVLIIENPQVWADNTQVIGPACQPLDCKAHGEFYNRYVLAGLDGSQVPLTGPGDGQSHQAWNPQFVSRWPAEG